MFSLIVSVVELIAEFRVFQTFYHGRGQFCNLRILVIFQRYQMYVKLSFAVLIFQTSFFRPVLLSLHGF